MASLDLSWASLGVDENDLMCVDPLAAAEALKRAINRLTDGEVVTAALRFGLNVRSDAMIVRNRLERHEMRRYFGSDAAPWDATRDEPAAEQPSTPSTSSSSRHSVANSSSNRVSQQPEVVPSIQNREPLSTGQSMGRYRDPLSMELPSQQFRSIVQIEVGDSRRVSEEARADSHAAPVTQGSEVPRRVSIAPPVAYADIPEPMHHPRAQSTRYNLSPRPPHENSTFVENTMELTGGADATAMIIPETTTGEATMGPSTIFDRTSFFPLPAFSQQTTSCAPTSEYQRRDCTRVSNGLSSSASQFDPLRNNVSVGNCNSSHQINSRANRSDFPSRFPSQLLEQAERGAGAAVYSHCAMPQGASCNHEPPLMSSGPVGPNFVTAGASQAHMYGARAEQTHPYYNQPAPPPSFHYPPGYGSQPWLSSQQMFTHAPLYPPYSCYIPPSFTQLQSNIPPPAVTGCQSAPIHPAYSFQPHPGRCEVSAPGMSQEASFFERSSLSKEKRTSELLSKWHISFKGDRKRDPESFIVDLTNCKETYKLTLDEIVKALPSVLDGESWQWFRREHQFWKTYEDLVDAFRLQYSFEDVQERLRKELEVRTQGPSEEISTYLLKVRDLLDQLKPPLTLGEQLDRVYQKLHPSYRLRIERKDFENFPELQRLGKREELRRAQEKAYKPPPPISDSAFPASAYIPPKQQRHVRLASVAQTSADEIEESLSSSSNLAPVATTQTDQEPDQKSSRERKAKPKDEQRGDKKDRKRDARSKSRGRHRDKPKKDRDQPSEPEKKQEELKIEEVPPKAKYEDMQRRKQREPCFRCGQAGHWRRECMNAAVCQNCGQPNTTARKCTRCNSATAAGNE